MSKYDAHKVVEDVVANAMKAQDAFVQNVERIMKEGGDLDAMIDHRNARTGIAIYAELKGIRTALTEIAQNLADKKENPPA